MSDQNQQWYPPQQASQPSANDPWAVGQPPAGQPSASDPYLAGQASANDPYPTIAKSPYGTQPQQGWEQAAPPAHASYSGQSPQQWEQQGYAQQAHDPYAAQGYQQNPYAAQPGYPQDPYAPQQGYPQDPYAAQQGNQPVGFPPPNPYAPASAHPGHAPKENGFSALFSLSFDKPVAATLGPTLFIIAMVSAGLTALQTILFPLLEYNSPLHFALSLLSAPVYALLFIGLVRLGIEGVICLNRLRQESRELKDLLSERPDEDAEA